MIHEDAPSSPSRGALARVRSLLSISPRFWVLTTGATASIVALRFALDTTDHFGADVSGISAYITAIGVLYGILAAFTIFVVWGQFNDAQNAVAVEAADLVDLFRLGVYLRDPEALAELQTSIVGYCDSVVSEEWEAMATGRRSRDTSDRFEAIFRAVHAVRFDDERDASAWAEMIRKFESVSDARAKRLDLAAVRLPGLLRGLLYLVSLALVSGFFMLAMENDFLLVTVTAATTAIVFLTIEVIEDLDDPFGGQWSLSPDQYVAISPMLERLSAASQAQGAL